MESNPDNQAMTEVALGLAMAFFALMILAMVSMSVKSEVKESAEAISAQVKAPESAKEKKVATKVTQEDFLIVFHKGQYFDSKLNQLALNQLPNANRYVLALHPNLSFDEVMKARTEISAPNLIITQLNESWIKRLSQQI